MINEPSIVPAERTKLRRFLRTHGALESFETLVAMLPHAAVFVVDADRNVLLWSEGAERLLGFTADEVLGRHCLTSNRCPQCIKGCGIAEYRSVRDVPLMLYAEDGRPVHVRKTAKAFFDEDGSFAGGIEVLWPDHDVQEEEHLAPPANVVTFHSMVSRSHPMLQAFDVVKNVAATDVTVLVRGDSGTGKELIAKALHAESERKKGPFVAVNCAAFTPTLLESELFGHVRGAFTGATRDRPGLFARADGGTLFLDEVAELPLELQAKLLRVLQERSFVPVGGTHPISVDVRIVSATHRALRAMVKEGNFREDLLYRLRVVPIYLPALRERREDIEVLLWHFIEQRNNGGPRKVRSVSPDAMKALLSYHWPGNVRELQNVVDYSFAVGRGGSLLMGDLPPEIRESQRKEPVFEPQSRPGPGWGGTEHASNIGPGFPAGAWGPGWGGWPEAPTQPPTGFAGPRYQQPGGWPGNIPSSFPPGDERTRIQMALQYANGHLGRAADMLGMSRTTLWRKRKKYEI